MRIVDALICYADGPIRQLYAAVLTITMPDGQITKYYRHDLPPDYILVPRFALKYVDRTHCPGPFHWGAGAPQMAMPRASSAA
jgi:hypothetical protein